MSDLIVSPSELQSFIESTSNNYSSIYDCCCNIINDMRSKYQSIELERSNIDSQISKVSSMIGALEKKISNYEKRVLEAETDVVKCNKQIGYVECHPMIITHTDSAGNKHNTYAIDPCAMSAALEAKELAESNLSKWKDNVGKAESVLSDVKSYLNTLCTIRNGIDSAAKSIESDIYQVSKYCDAIHKEKQYNLDSLNEVMHKINTYTSCKRFSAPLAAASFTEYSKSKKYR